MKIKPLILFFTSSSSEVILRSEEDGEKDEVKINRQ